MPSNRARATKTVQDVSSGGVVARIIEGGVEVVLVRRLAPERWGLPKGAVETAESIDQTALREVKEETGLDVRIVEPLPEISYWFFASGARHRKTVHFYLLESIGGDTADHDWEHDKVEWLPAAEALRRISFPNERSVLETAVSQAQRVFQQRPRSESDNPLPRAS
ncbi:MAG: NUDIX hydrolase [Chloroflexi bacterium]|nr:NUDIX hydrolase [Chloroflexota bacterium]